MNLNVKCSKTVKSLDFSNLEVLHDVDLEVCPTTDFSRLQTVHYLTVSAPQSKSVKFPALKYCGFCQLDPTMSTEFVFPALEETGTFRLVSYSPTVSLSIPSLKKASESLTIGFTSLETLSAPALVYAGQFMVNDNPKLVSVHAPVLQTVGAMDFDRNGMLPKILFPKLEKVDYTAVYSHNNLTDISFPVLTESKEVKIGYAGRLNKIHFPLLHKTNFMWINKTADNLCIDLVCFDQAPRNFNVTINGALKDCPVCGQTKWQDGCSGL